MPRAKDNRKPVGTAYCDRCDAEAAFYQVQSGKRRGYLYKRCGCGCDQKTGEAVQREWLGEMVPTGVTMLEHPLIAKGEPPESQGTDTGEPEENQGTETAEPQQPRKVGGVFGVLIVVGAVALALIA